MREREVGCVDGEMSRVLLFSRFGSLFFYFFEGILFFSEAQSLTQSSVSKNIKEV